MPDLMSVDQPRTALELEAATLVHCCNGLDPRRDGGMVPSILGMTGAIARRSRSLRIVTPTPSRLELDRVPPGVRLVGPENDYLDAIRNAEVVHFHGLWQAHTRVGARVARQGHVPYLMAAHGMAEPWALRHKAFKKKVYTALVEGRNLRRASCLHALSRPEVTHLRALAPRTPIGLVPNGVDLAPFADLPPRAVLEREHPELVGKFVVLFFGRLHQKKGLDLLAEAMGSIRHDHPHVHVLLAGLDDGALTPFRAQSEAAGVADRYTYVGHVGGESARAVWAAADAFILPSYSEGFSMAILEALACRLPAVVTTACHFNELDPAGAAIVVEPTATGVSAGLRDLVERSPSERATLGQRGRELVERDYTWDRQADRLAGIYRWVTGGGPAPDAVLEARGIAQ